MLTLRLDDPLTIKAQIPLAHDIKYWCMSYSILEKLLKPKLKYKVVEPYMKGTNPDGAALVN
jgi:hypothetical protein